MTAWNDSGAVFDTGALIALDRRSRVVAAMVDEARRGNARIPIPAGCVGQAWRDPARQARLASLCACPTSTSSPLMGPKAAASDCS